MFKTDAPDLEWMNRLRQRRFTHDTIFPDRELETLKRKLLQYGGVAVVLAHDEPDLEQIMRRGEIASGAGSIKIPGTRSNCHENSYGMWKNHPATVRLCTGYALSSDGLWRQHSWTQIRGRIAETTVERVAYFGFTLTDEEAARWVA